MEPLAQRCNLDMLLMDESRPRYQTNNGPLRGPFSFGNEQGLDLEGGTAARVIPASRR